MFQRAGTAALSLAGTLTASASVFIISEFESGWHARHSFWKLTRVMMELKAKINMSLVMPNGNLGLCRGEVILPWTDLCSTVKKKVSWVSLNCKSNSGQRGLPGPRPCLPHPVRMSGYLPKAVAGASLKGINPADTRSYNLQERGAFEEDETEVKGLTS